MRGHFKVFAITVFLGIPVFAQNAAPSRLDRPRLLVLAKKRRLHPSTSSKATQSDLPTPTMTSRPTDGRTLSSAWKAF